MNVDECDDYNIHDDDTGVSHILENTKLSSKGIGNGVFYIVKVSLIKNTNDPS
jgi:hypothetical protein